MCQNLKDFWQLVIKVSVLDVLKWIFHVFHRSPRHLFPVCSFLIYASVDVCVWTTRSVVSIKKE